MSGIAVGALPESSLAGPKLEIPPGAVTDLIAAQAERTPDRVAIEWSGGESWTYAQLMRRVDAIAHALLARGVARGEPVGVYTPRRPDMVSAALGAMRAGATYLPLDPAFPDKPLRYMATFAKIRHLLVWRKQEAPAWMQSETSVLAVDELVPAAVATLELPALIGDDLAYVLFTSGSTGQPKGVRVLHRNLLNDLVSIQHEPGVTDDDVFGAFTTVAFDASLHELFLPLLVGGRVAIASRAEQSNPVAAAAFLRRFPVTLLEITPTQLQQMLVQDRLRELHDVRLWAGGEALPRDLAEKVLPACRELWNTYGPTETTIESTIHRLTRGSGSVPIGKPIANTTIHLLDESASPVAAGEVGEIWIAGAGVADGYLHDPEKTAEKFRPDPFAADGSRMYRTGDLGSLHAGELHFHGRTDEQINIHGARVEPGEIEAVVLSESGVHQAMVAARDLGNEDVQLVLYVVADQVTGLVARLHARLQTSLPPHMRPPYIETLATLPTTPSGKVDRKALPLPRSIQTHHSSIEAKGPAAVFPSRPNDSHAPSSSLVAIQPRGSRPPLFLVHALDGKVHAYVPLARGLGADQPVYGLQAIGLDGITPPGESIANIAARHVSAIQRLQPRGPYFLAGSSMGGAIAYEMARQLRERGETLGFLAVLGNRAPDDRTSAELPLAAAVPKTSFGSIGRALDAWRVRRARAAGRTLPRALCQRELERAHRRAWLAYSAPQYDGTLVLFLPRERPDDGKRDKTVGWARFARGGVEVIEIPCTGDNLMDQPELLRKLREALQRSQAPA